MLAAALLTDALRAYLRESGMTVPRRGEPGFVTIPDDPPLLITDELLLNRVWNKGAVSGTLEPMLVLDDTDDS